MIPTGDENKDELETSRNILKHLEATARLSQTKQEHREHIGHLSSSDRSPAPAAPRMFKFWAKELDELQDVRMEIKRKSNGIKNIQKYQNDPNLTTVSEERIECI